MVQEIILGEQALDNVLLNLTIVFMTVSATFFLRMRLLRSGRNGTEFLQREIFKVFGKLSNIKLRKFIKCMYCNF